MPSACAAQALWSPRFTLWRRETTLSAPRPSRELSETEIDGPGDRPKGVKAKDELVRATKMNASRSLDPPGSPATDYMSSSDDDIAGVAEDCVELIDEVLNLNSRMEAAGLLTQFEVRGAYSHWYKRMSGLEMRYNVNRDARGELLRAHGTLRDALDEDIKIRKELADRSSFVDAARDILESRQVLTDLERARMQLEDLRGSAANRRPGAPTP